MFPWLRDGTQVTTHLSFESTPAAFKGSKNDVHGGLRAVPPAEEPPQEDLSVSHPCALQDRQGQLGDSPITILDNSAFQAFSVDEAVSFETSSRQSLLAEPDVVASRGADARPAGMPDTRVRHEPRPPA
jgi:hypothetical protein